jgi:hypothetical protein
LRQPTVWIAGIYKEKIMTPYDTGKVKIGINYQPKQYVEVDKDMLYLQEMLIRKAKKFSWRELIKRLFW